nr:MAG TPA: hypothetical protein [Caudoviricetes sp.]
MTKISNLFYHLTNSNIYSTNSIITIRRGRK